MSVHVAKFLAGIGTWLSVLILVALPLTTWYLVNAIRSPGAPALIIHKMSIANPVVTPGEPVTFQMNATRTANCPSIIASFWMTEDGRPWTRFPPITGGYTSASPAPYDVSFDVPAPAGNTLTGRPPEPGVYVYRSINAPLCNNLSPTETPLVRICLKVLGQPEPTCARQMMQLSWPSMPKNDFAVTMLQKELPW